MKLVFSHDHYFYHSGTDIYSPGKLPYSSFSRYLLHFDELTVLARYKYNTVVSPYWTKSSGPGVSFIKLENNSSLRSVILRNQTNVMLIETALKECDGVVVRLPSEIGLLTASLARKMGIPYIAEVVACPWDAMVGYGSAKSLLYAPCLFWRVRKAVKNAWAAHYVTDKFLQKRYPNKNISVSASDVELPEILPSILEARLDKIKGNFSRPMILGLIGSLDSPHKGFDTIYRAMHLLQEKGISITLKIVGGGNKFKNMTLLGSLSLTEHVFFLGPKVSGEDIFCFLDSIDLYIQPSNQEGLPRAVIEAMSRACPVITSSAGGMPELCQAEYIHKPNDFVTLASKIELAITSREAMLSMAEYAFSRATQFNTHNLSEIRFNLFNKYKEHLFLLRKKKC